MKPITLKTRIKNFPWGRVIQVHRFNDFAIIEYIDSRLEDNTSAYQPYLINDNEEIRDLGWSFRNLDEAVLNAIAFKYDGLNSQAGRLMTKAIGIYDKEDA